MSWEQLKTNYADAVFSGLRKYRTINNEDGTVSFEDVTDYEVKEESYFGAKDVNSINGAINSIMGSLGKSGNLDELQTQTKESLVDAINELANKEIDVLDTAEAIKANTRSGKVAGAKGTKELFERVSERLAWKEKGTVTGTAAVIPLPDSYNELKIVCYKDNYSILNITLPQNEITAAVKTYYNSFYNDMKNQYYIVVEYSSSGIRLIKAFWGTNIASSVVTKLYYR